MNDPVEVLRALLAGEPGAGAALAPAVRGEAFGVEAFGGQGVAKLLALDPVKLSPQPHVVRTAQGLALFDADPEGREVAVVADLYDGVIGRLWRVGAAGEGACAAMREAATPVAFDPFLSQARGAEAFAVPDLPELDAAGRSALGAASVREGQAAAAGTRRLVIRAFGAEGRAAALLAAAGPASGERVAPHVALAFRYDADALLHVQAVADRGGWAQTDASAFTPLHVDSSASGSQFVRHDA